MGLKQSFRDKMVEINRAARPTPETPVLSGSNQGEFDDELFELQRRRDAMTGTLKSLHHNRHQHTRLWTSQHSATNRALELELLSKPQLEAN